MVVCLCVLCGRNKINSQTGLIRLWNYLIMIDFLFNYPVKLCFICYLLSLRHTHIHVYMHICMHEHRIIVVYNIYIWCYLWSMIKIRYMRKTDLLQRNISVCLFSSLQIIMYGYIHVHVSSSSSRAATTDILDPLSPLFPIVHRLRQVFWVTSCVLT